MWKKNLTNHHAHSCVCFLNKQTKNRRNISQLDNGHFLKPTANLLLPYENLSPCFKSKVRICILTTFGKQKLKPKQYNKGRTRNKWHPDQRAINKMSLFSDNMIFYTETPRTKLQKGTGYIQVQHTKPKLFLYSSNEQLETNILECIHHT